MASSVAVNVPPIMPVPMATRLFAPAPVATASGITPAINASEVIMIGRRRVRAARRAARAKELPCCTAASANSTIRMAFFDDRPIVVSSATGSRRRYSVRASRAASAAPSTPSGITRITEIGTDQLSYSAAVRKTTIIEMAYRLMARPLASFSCSERPLHAQLSPLASCRPVFHFGHRHAGAGSRWRFRPGSHRPLNRCNAPRAFRAVLPMRGGESRERRHVAVAAAHIPFVEVGRCGSRVAVATGYRPFHTATVSKVIHVGAAPVRWRAYR